MSKVLIFIPTYNCSQQIPRVLKGIPKELCNSENVQILIIDNCSSDSTLKVAIESIDNLGISNIRIYQQQFNLGLGGSHKAAIRLCILENFDFLVVLHGDDQTTLNGLPINLHNIGSYDCALGSRFMKGSRLVGYSKFRIVGNRLLNFFYGVALNARVSDMGSGLNIYGARLLREVKWEVIPDDLTFNNILLLETFRKGFKHLFFPIEWREIDQQSNARLIQQSFKIVGNLALSILRKHSSSTMVRGRSLVDLPNMNLIQVGSKK